jgi:type VI protein secretion system component Hcp
MDADPPAQGVKIARRNTCVVLVTSVHVEASKDNQPAENVALSFKKVEFGYRPTKPDGSLGAQETFKWDVTAVKPV